MTPLYTERYFQDYLRLSIDIFQRHYKVGTSYLNHEKWQVFLELLKNAGVDKILLYEEMYIGSISIKYGHAPITKNSTPEYKVRERHRILEEIVL